MDEKIKEKQYFLVKVEGLAPVTVEYRVLAEDKEEALQIFDHQPGARQLVRKSPPDLNRLVKKKITIINTLTGVLEYLRNY